MNSDTVHTTIVVTIFVATILLSIIESIRVYDLKNKKKDELANTPLLGVVYPHDKKDNQ
jgi:hypothetical protein